MTWEAKRKFPNFFEPNFSTSIKGKHLFIVVRSWWSFALLYNATHQVQRSKIGTKFLALYTRLYGTLICTHCPRVHAAILHGIFRYYFHKNLATHSSETGWKIAVSTCHQICYISCRYWVWAPSYWPICASLTSWPARMKRQVISFLCQLSANPCAVRIEIALPDICLPCLVIFQLFDVSVRRRKRKDRMIAESAPSCWLVLEIAKKKGKKNFTFGEKSCFREFTDWTRRNECVWELYVKRLVCRLVQYVRSCTMLSSLIFSCIQGRGVTDLDESKTRGHSWQMWNQILRRMLFCKWHKSVRIHLISACKWKRPAVGLASRNLGCHEVQFIHCVQVSFGFNKTFGVNSRLTMCQGENWCAVDCHHSGLPPHPPMNVIFPGLTSLTGATAELSKWLSWVGF